MLGLASREQAQWARAVLSQAQQQLASLQAPAAENEATQQGPAALREGAVSSWVLTALCIQTLRVVVQGYWTPTRLRVCLPHLRRFVRGSPRRRSHQESSIRRSLTTQLGIGVHASSPLFLASSA